MIPVYRPDNPGVLAIAESLLMAEGIPYFVHNKYFGGLYPFVQIDLYNTRTVMVSEEDWPHAREILTPLLTAEPESSLLTSPSWSQKLRMLLEVSFLGWFIPPKSRWKALENSEDSNTSPEGLSP